MKSLLKREEKGVAQRDAAQAVGPRTGWFRGQ